MQSAVKTKTFHPLLPFIICTLGTIFVLYEFILQVSPSVITEQLMRDLKTNAAGLGMVTAFFYYAYTPMQIPAGLLFDRWGPRRLITAAFIVCALGAVFFSRADSLLLACLGRFFIGIGSAFSFVGALILVAQWFPARYFALGAGIVQLMSSVGSVVGEGPLAATVSHYGWRETITGIALLGFFFAIVIWLIVRDKPNHESQVESDDSEKLTEWQRLKQVCRNPQNWAIACFSFLIWAPIVIFAGMWGVPYLRIAYHISDTVAGSAMSLVWIAVGIGSPLIGFWSDRIESRLIPFIVCAALGLISLFLITYWQSMPWPMMLILLFVFGLGASPQALSFAYIKDINKPNIVGSAMGFNNMAVVAGGAILQPLVSILLQNFWSGDMANGAPVYHLVNYQKAFFILPLTYFIALILCFYPLKETHCQVVFETELDETKSN